MIAYTQALLVLLKEDGTLAIFSGRGCASEVFCISMSMTVSEAVMASLARNLDLTFAVPLQETGVVFSASASRSVSFFLF